MHTFGTGFHFQVNPALTLGLAALQLMRTAASVSDFAGAQLQVHT